jgi:hypothetical protein
VYCHPHRGRQPTGFVNHVSVGVESDRLCEPVGKQQGQGTGAATDVEKAAGTVQVQLHAEGVSDGRGVGEATSRVVGGAAGIQRRIPLPHALSHAEQRRAGKAGPTKQFLPGIGSAFRHAGRLGSRFLDP